MKRSMPVATEAWVAAAIIGALVLAPRYQRAVWDWATGRPSPDERLIVATAGNDVNAFQAAVADGASARGRDPRGTTALMVAAARGKLELTQALIAMGAEIETADQSGQTPLMLAAQNNHPDLILLLLQKGADPARRNRLGETALDVAVVFHAERAEAVLADVAGRRAGK